MLNSDPGSEDASARTDAEVRAVLRSGPIGAMLVAGIATAERHMPCQEFCGVGHEGMWANLKIIDKAAFTRMAATTTRLSCVK